MPKRTTKKPTLTLNEEELKVLNEVLENYKEMIKFTYTSMLAHIKKGESELKRMNNKWESIEAIKELQGRKEDAAMIDIARLRADWLHLKVKESLGIKDEGDESTKSDGTRTEQDGSASDESDAEVSESSEVLHQN